MRSNDSIQRSSPKEDEGGERSKEAGICELHKRPDDGWQYGKLGMCQEKLVEVVDVSDAEI
jgi:hypothetical protein